MGRRKKIERDAARRKHGKKRYRRKTIKPCRAATTGVLAAFRRSRTMSQMLVASRRTPPVRVFHREAVRSPKKSKVEAAVRTITRKRRKRTRTRARTTRKDRQQKVTTKRPVSTEPESMMVGMDKA